MAVYYATKAYVLSFTEALADELSGTGVTISVLCPGPTESNFSNVARGQKSRRIQTSKMSAEAVARCGYRAYRNGKAVAVPGFGNNFLIFLTRIMPRWFVRKAVKSFNRVNN